MTLVPAADVAELMTRGSRWDTVGVWLALAVALGVACEAVTEFDTLARWLRLHSPERQKLRHGIAKGGLLVLILALSFEVVAAIRTHNISQTITAALSQQVKENQSREQQLIAATVELRAKGVLQEGTLQSLGKRADAFETMANAQREQYDRALKMLAQDEAKLDKAQIAATASAAKAAKAAQLADKTAGDMQSTLDSERAIEGKMRAIVTPRQLTYVQVLELTKVLKQYAGTRFDLSAYPISDSLNLARQIGLMLRTAGWDWISLNTLQSLGFKDLPRIGAFYEDGLMLEACKSNVDRLEPVSEGFHQAFASIAGLSFTGRAYDDADASQRQMPCEILHIEIGSK